MASPTNSKSICFSIRTTRTLRTKGLVTEPRSFMTNDPVMEELGELYTGVFSSNRFALTSVQCAVLIKAKIVVFVVSKIGSFGVMIGTSNCSTIEGGSMNNASSFRFLDLFSGIGGFHHALQSLGGECVLACEIDGDARKIYCEIFDPAQEKFPFIDNIRHLTRSVIDDEETLLSPEDISRLVPDHEVLCGGFPCQPFSKSGGQQGIKDKTRGTLFFDILQIIEAKRPSYLFLENVRNLAGPRHADTWQTIVSSLRDLGYVVASDPLIFSPHLLPPKFGGAPQVRERVFILGVREDVEKGQIENLILFNQGMQGKKLWDPDQWRIADYLEDDETLENIQDHEVSKNEEMYLEAWNYFVETIEQDLLPGFPIWAFAFQPEPQLTADMASWEVDFRIKNSRFYIENKDFIDQWKQMKWGTARLTVPEFPVSRQKFEWQARKKHPGRKGRTLKDLVIQFRPSGIRVKPPTYLPALVAITQTSVVGPMLRKHAKTYRKLTLVEAGRLQGLPDHIYQKKSVSPQAAYKQLGNAVNVGTIQRVAGILLGVYPTVFDREPQLALLF
ncbi:MAG: DNA (cytosine-5-)-methyltransferase [Ferrovum sp.]|nr:DNA (cytosine-5-)-methyltransferase [Ferrovum sp.]